MSGRNKCWQYYTTQNDRGPLYLNYILLTNKKKQYTNAVKHIYINVKHIYNITI